MVGIFPRVKVLRSRVKQLFRSKASLAEMAAAFRLRMGYRERLVADPTAFAKGLKRCLTYMLPSLVIASGHLVTC